MLLLKTEYSDECGEIICVRCASDHEAGTLNLIFRHTNIAQLIAKKLESKCEFYK